jgi:hypothetical protein
LIAFHPPSVSVFSPQYAFVRSGRLASRGTSYGALYPLRDGTWLLGARIPTPELIGLSIHISDGNAAILRSVGRLDTITPGAPGIGIPNFRLTADQQTIWIANGYSLGRWRLRDNAHLEQIEVHDIPWMKPPVYRTVRGRGGQPTQVRVGGTTVMLTGADTSGRLWMYGRTTDSLTNSTEVPQVLELLDPRTGTVVTSQPMPYAIQLLPSGDLAFSGALDERGVLTITVWSFRIVGR